MERRKFLGLLGAAGVSGASGCLEPIQDITRSSTKGQRRITDIETDLNPTDFNLAFAVDIVQRESTPDTPMTLSVSLTNVGENDIIVAGSNNDAFSSQESQSGGLLLVQPTFWDTEEIVSDDCWRMQSEKPILSTPSESDFRPNETESEEYNLIASSSSGQCIPAGEYRFETRFQTIVGEQSNRRVSGEFNWGFNVEVSLV